MNRQEVTELFSVMMLAWPNAEMFKGGIQKLGPTINLWAMCLKDITFEIGQQTVVKLCEECKFPPTIAEFKEASIRTKESLENEMTNAWWKLRSQMDAGFPLESFERALVDTKTKAVVLSLGGPEALVRKDESGKPFLSSDLFFSEYERMAMCGGLLFPEKSKDVKRIGGAVNDQRRTCLPDPTGR